MSLRSAATLGAVVVRNHWESGDAMFTEAMGGDEDAVFFVQSMCALRQSRRRPLQCDVLLQQYNDAFNDDAALVRASFKARQTPPPRGGASQLAPFLLASPDFLA